MAHVERRACWSFSVKTSSPRFTFPPCLRITSPTSRSMESRYEKTKTLDDTEALNYTVYFSWKVLFGSAILLVINRKLKGKKRQCEGHRVGFTLSFNPHYVCRGWVIKEEKFLEMVHHTVEIIRQVKDSFNSAVMLEMNAEMKP